MTYYVFVFPSSLYNSNIQFSLFVANHGIQRDIWTQKPKIPEHPQCFKHGLGMLLLTP